jgi:hypothetical protein
MKSIEQRGSGAGPIRESDAPAGAIAGYDRYGRRLNQSRENAPARIDSTAASAVR